MFYYERSCLIHEDLTEVGHYMSRSPLVAVGLSQGWGLGVRVEYTPPPLQLDLLDLHLVPEFLISSSKSVFLPLMKVKTAFTSSYFSPTNSSDIDSSFPFWALDLLLRDWYLFTVDTAPLTHLSDFSRREKLKFLPTPDAPFVSAWPARSP